MIVVDHYPLQPGEMFKDCRGVWFMCCPHCGTISNSDKIDRWFECPECLTIFDLSGIVSDLASEIGRITQHQMCKVCGNRDKFDFHVPDEVWQSIVPFEYQNRVVCLSCFDDFANEKGIEYSIDTLYFAGDKEMFVFKKE